MGPGVWFLTYSINQTAPCKASFCSFPSLQRGFRLATFTISEILIGDLSEIKGIRARPYGYYI